MAWWNPFSKDASSTPSARRVDHAALRAFAAARADRLTADWKSMISSIDADIRAGGVRLRARSRDLAQNNDYCRGAFRTIQNEVIGMGVNFEARVMMKRGRGGELRLNDPVNEAIYNAWYKWGRAKNCDVERKKTLQEIARLLIRQIAVDGEVLIRKVRLARGDMGAPYALEILDCDMLDETLNGFARGTGNEIRMGVEVDQWGAPVAYHLRAHHPGDYASQAVSARQNEPLRIPAREMIHLFLPERAKQTRGIPWLVSSILRMRHLGGYEEAEVVAARIAASSMGFIESAASDMPLEDGQDANGDSVTDFEPANIKRLFPGEKFSAANFGRPAAGVDAFVRLMLRGLATGIGCSYESVSGDYSQSNYSSTRQSMLKERDGWKVLQQWMIDNFFQPVYEDFLDAAVLAGDLTLADFFTNQDAYKWPRWLPRGWAWIDPTAEASAYGKAVRDGFLTQADVIAQQGGDFDDFMKARKREVEQADKMGLYFDTNPELVSAAGLTQARPQGTTLPGDGSEKPAEKKPPPAKGDDPKPNEENAE